MNKYDDLARTIIRNVGGRSNIQSLTHCVTRLRFRLKDESKADTETLNHTAGIVTVIRNGGQYMLVVGNHVTELYNAVCRLGHILPGGTENAASAHPSFLSHLRKLFARNTPEPVPEDSIVIGAPVPGIVYPLEKIEDPVFASEVLGSGCAIEPGCGEITAPFDGRIIQVAQTGHAIGICGKNGVELLIHVGMDTVELKGKGFQPKVKVGDEVHKGQLLLLFDREAIAAAGYKLMTPVVVTNTPDFSEVRMTTTGRVNAEQTILVVLK